MTRILAAFAILQDIKMQYEVSMSQKDNTIVLSSYAAVSLIIFGVAYLVQGRYSHELLAIPVLVFIAAAATHFKFLNDKDRN